MMLEVLLGHKERARLCLSINTSVPLHHHPQRRFRLLAARAVFYTTLRGLEEKASCNRLEGSLMRYHATCTNADGKETAAGDKGRENSWSILGRIVALSRRRTRQPELRSSRSFYYRTTRLSRTYLYVYVHAPESSCVCVYCPRNWEWAKDGEAEEPV